jgi:hypothetical protein
MADNAKTTTVPKIPKPIEYVGDFWKDETRPIVLITETEETERQTSDTEEDNIPVIQTLVRKEKEISGESSVGKTVMKQFEAGLFSGQVVTATKNRGRFLYHVVYEDGDEEDMDDQEFKDAYELYKIETNKPLKANGRIATKDESENENDKNGGETEGSEYNVSEDDDKKQKRKKRRTRRDKQIKEKAKKGGENPKRGGCARWDENCHHRCECAVEAHFQKKRDC